MNRAWPTVLGVSCWCIAMAAQATDVRPGLWEFRSTHMSMMGLPDLSAHMGQMQQHLKSLPPDMRRMVEQQMAERGVNLGKDGAVQSCITPEQAKQDNIYSGRTEGNCTLADVVKTGKTVTGRLTCTEPQATGTFEAQIHGPERFTTRMDLKSPNGDMQVETDARWIAEHCPARQGTAPRAGR